MDDCRNSLDRFVSAVMANKMFRRGYEAFFVHVVEVDKPHFDGKFIPTLNDFLDVHSEEILGLPPQEEVEFSVELISDTTSVSIAFYRMAPTELK